MLTHLVPVGSRPTGLGDRGLSPLLRDLTEFVIAGLAEKHTSASATLLCNGTCARDTLETAWIREALAIIPKLGQECWGEKITHARQGSEKRMIRMLREQLLEPRDFGFFMLDDAE